MRRAFALLAALVGIASAQSNIFGYHKAGYPNVWASSSDLSSVTKSFRSVTNTRDTVKPGDYVLALSGAVPDTIVLPSVSPGRLLCIKRTDALSTLHVVAGAIDGYTNYTFSWPWEAIELIATAANTFAIIGGR